MSRAEQAAAAAEAAWDELVSEVAELKPLTDWQRDLAREAFQNGFVRGVKFCEVPK